MRLPFKDNSFAHVLKIQLFTVITGSGGRSSDNLILKKKKSWNLPQTNYKITHYKNTCSTIPHTKKGRILFIWAFECDKNCNHQLELCTSYQDHYNMYNWKYSQETNHISSSSNFKFGNNNIFCTSRVLNS